ncbi:MAG: AraC family transcriptional regulator [Chitinophagales bacterium]|nr:AraC family transcriptional regulator [Chitinophagales bacterium]
MNFREIKPCKELAPYIHFFWEFKGDVTDNQWERSFPDGCPGVVINLGDTYKTENGAMEFGKTYVLGTKTSFKEGFITPNTHLLGVYLKPASFPNFFDYASQDELADTATEIDKPLSLNLDKVMKDPTTYLNRFFTDKLRHTNRELHEVIRDIHRSKGLFDIYELAKKNCTTVRQLERQFKKNLGASPKEYSNIVRFQNAFSMLINNQNKRSLLDIAFECGYYDHSHLTNEIKKYTGFAPSQLFPSHTAEANFEVLHTKYSRSGEF